MRGDLQKIVFWLTLCFSAKYPRFSYFSAMTLTFLRLSLATLLLSANCFAQNPDWIWAKKQGGASNEFSLSVCTDPSGNIFTCGYFISPTLTIGSNTLTCQGSYDIMVVKYDALGIPIWARSFGTNQDDYANAVATDAQGNVYVTGFFSGTSISFGSFTLNNFGPGTADMYLLKLDPSGNVLWAVGFGGNYWDTGQSLRVDPSNGAVYMAGYFSSTSVDFGTGPVPTNGLADAFLSRHDPANGNTLWVISAGGEVNDLANGVDVDAAGNVFITGGWASDTIRFGPNDHINAGPGFPDIFTAKYSANGNYIWSVTEGGPDNDHADAIVIDRFNNVIIGGHYHSTSFVAGSTTLNNGGMGDPFIFKYDNGGNIQWAKDAGGPFNDFSYSVTVDSSGNSYLTGMFISPSITFGSTTLTNASGVEDMFLTKYDPNGNELWALGDGDAYSDYINDIFIDRNSDKLFATGDMFSPTITMGSTLLTNVDNTGSTSDFFLAKLDMVTGLEPLSFSTLQCFPNPSSGILHFKGILGTAVIEIRDLAGRLILQGSIFQNDPLDLRMHELTGVYLLKVQTEFSESVMKLSFQ